MKTTPEDIMATATATHEAMMGADIEDEPLILARALLAERTRALSQLEAGTVKPLEWVEHPGSFPAPNWSAQTPFGFYNIEEIWASDSPAYEVRLHAHRLVAVVDGLPEAKAAAQADYSQRILSALASPSPAPEAEPVGYLVTTRRTGQTELREQPVADLPYNRERFVCQPLYTTPTPAVDADAVIEACAKIADAYIGGEYEAQGRAAEEIAAEIRALSLPPSADKGE